MRCRQCQYSLWNIRGRVCPECGSSFRAADYPFVPNSVRFSCPHCQQAYYGTSDTGHLVPSAFTCVGCQQHVTEEEMVLNPADGVTDHETLGLDESRLPWLSRDRGFLSRWSGTTGWAMVKPNLLGRNLPEAGGAMAAYAYALLTLGSYMTIAFLPFVGLMLFLALTSARAGPLGPTLGGLGFIFVVMLLFAAVALPLWALCAHGILRITGPTARGLDATLCCTCYTSACNVASAIPCFSVYFSWLTFIWQMVSMSIALMTAQRVPAWRAVLATVLPPLVPTVILIAIIAVRVWRESQIP